MPDAGTDPVMAKMDTAAEAARLCFPHDAGADAVCRWWRDWYLNAGHKRLGRLLVSLAKKSEAASGTA